METNVVERLNREIIFTRLRRLDGLFIGFVQFGLGSGKRKGREGVP